MSELEDKTYKRTEVLADQIETHRNRAYKVGEKLDEMIIPIVQCLGGVASAYEQADMNEDSEKIKKLAENFVASMEDVNEVFGLMGQDLANLAQHQLDELAEFRKAIQDMDR